MTEGFSPFPLVLVMYHQVLQWHYAWQLFSKRARAMLQGTSAVKLCSIAQVSWDRCCRARSSPLQVSTDAEGQTGAGACCLQGLHYQLFTAALAELDPPHAAGCHRPDAHEFAFAG